MIPLSAGQSGRFPGAGGIKCRGTRRSIPGILDVEFQALREVSGKILVRSGRKAEETQTSMYEGGRNVTGRPAGR